MVVASTGNQQRSDYYAFPAAWDEVVGVGGANSNDEYVLNNYAPGNVELAAPAIGVGAICKGGGGKADVDGTSFATPMVAGALMVLRERFPTESASRIRERLRAGAVPMTSTLKSGVGRFDLLSSVQWTPPPPTYAADISGPSEVIPNDVNCQWSASTNITGPSFEWRVGGALIGTASVVWYSAAQDFTLELFVSNSSGHTATKSKSVSVAGSNPCPA